MGLATLFSRSGIFSQKNVITALDDTIPKLSSSAVHQQKTKLLIAGNLTYVNWSLIELEQQGDDASPDN